MLRFPRLPGLLLSIAVAGAAFILATLAKAAWAAFPLEPLVLAILIGMAVRALMPMGERFEAGIGFAAKQVLEITVVLIGATLSLAQLALFGWQSVLLLAALVALTLAASYAIGRFCGLARSTALLLAAGNAICGNSAISAVGPVVGARRQVMATAIAFTALISVLYILILPPLGFLFGLEPQRYGLFVGLTVYAVPQVLAATESHGETAMQVAMLVKLARVAMLGPLVLGLSLFIGRGGESRAPLVPWFIIGFVIMVLLRSFNLLPPALLDVLVLAAKVLSVVAMAGLGLGVDLAGLKVAGPRVSLAVVLSLAALMLFSLGMLPFL